MIKLKEVRSLYTNPVFTWKSSGNCPTLSSDETDKEGDLVSRVLPVTFDETWDAPRFETAWHREEV